MLIDLQSLWEINYRLNQAQDSTSNSYLIVGAPSINQYEFVPESGVYTLNGTTATVFAGRVLGIGVGAYVLTGTSTGLRATRLLQVANGSYTLSGTSVALPAGRLASVAPGSYILAGTDVTLTFTGSAAANVHLLATMGCGV